MKSSSNNKRNIILFIFGVFVLGLLIGFLVNFLFPVRASTLKAEGGVLGVTGRIVVMLFVFSIPIGYFLWMIIGLSQVSRPKEPSKAIRFENIPKEAHVIEKILIPVGDGPNVMLGLQLVSQLSTAEKGKITLLRIIPPFSSTDIESQRQLVHDMAHHSLLDLQHDFDIDVAIETNRDIVQGILDFTKREKYDLLILGASEQKHIGNVLFGTIPYRLTRLSPCPVLIIRKPQV
jgi:nucleotide-binding universal stress UspA family protein